MRWRNCCCCVVRFMTTGSEKPSLRELFPDARLLCVCVEDRDACHAGCSWFKERSSEIRKWVAMGNVDEQAV